MRVRRGRYGEFLGCSRYPNCGGTRPLPERMGRINVTASAAFWLRAHLSPPQRLLLRAVVVVTPFIVLGLLIANSESVGRLVVEWLWRR